MSTAVRPSPARFSVAAGRWWPRGGPLRALVAALVLGSCLGGCAASAPALYPAGSGGVNRGRMASAPTVVLVSLDGFRADYLDRFAAPNLQSIAHRGARARQGMRPVFPTKTFPNHISLVTGLYAEQHGIVANSFYDPARGATYSIGTPTVTDGSWYRGEPIWGTAERQGMVTASYFWVGSEAAIGGIRPTTWKPYDGSVPYDARVDSALAWLRRPAATRPHLVTLYMSAVDDAGHRHGPNATETGEAVATVDRAMGRLMAGLQTLPQAREVTLVVVSDHGMQATRPDDAVALESLIDTTGVRIADGGPNANLHVRGGPAQAVAVRDSLNRHLAHGRAYLRGELPERFHYRSDPRAGDVVVVMEAPYLITARARLPRAPGGTHGWDPLAPSMQALFLAMGPGIAAGTDVPPFENVEVYSFVAEVLGLRPAPGVMGRPGWLRGVLRGRR